MISHLDSLLIAVIVFFFATQSHTSYICFDNPLCNLTESQQFNLQVESCCQYGGLSYSTLEVIKGQPLYGDCIICQFALNIMIQPSHQYYETQTRFSPHGGKTILSFPVEIHLNYYKLTNNATLPTALPYPQDSILDLIYKEGIGEAIEYSRIDPQSGSLTTGIINKETYQGSGVPMGKFIPVVRNDSYNGSVLIRAEYLLASREIEVGYTFVVLECLECNNGGRPNAECTECNCLDGFVGELCENYLNTTNTHCTSDTCQNNGTCNMLQDMNTTCNCTKGFNGSFCEFDIDECSTNNHTCTISGECQNTFGSFTCVCDIGFSGERCDIDFDECQVVLCVHHSTCQNFYGSFKCICDVGYTGESCDAPILPCDAANCSNNTVVCINSQPEGTTYTCVCRNGFQGQYCEDDIDECQNSPCLNNGACFNTNGGYNCQNQTIGGVSDSNTDSKVAIGIGVTLILILMLIGFGVVIAWVAYLVKRYLRIVRYYAKQAMVKELEEEHLHSEHKIVHRGKYMKKEFTRLNAESEMSDAINYQADMRDDIVETIL